MLIQDVDNEIMNIILFMFMKIFIIIIVIFTSAKISGHFVLQEKLLVQYILKYTLISSNYISISVFCGHILCSGITISRLM